MPVNFSVEKYSHYGECYKITNGTVELFVTKEMGPRIICYRLVGGTNMLAELSLDQKLTTELGDWRPMGGHRLWHAPEVLPRSYWPDNEPVQVEVVDENSVCFTPPAEDKIGIQKEILITLEPEGTGVTVYHAVTNVGAWPIELAPWALTIMNGGGTAIVPQEPFVSHDDYLLPARPMVLWHFTDLSDSRFRFGKKYVTISTDANKTEPTKLGFADKQEWAGYLREGTLFIKRFPYCDCCEFPDYGSNCEVYTEGNFIEVESLGALTPLEPGETAEHEERWFLFKDVNIGDTDESLDAAITPLVAQTEE